MSTRANFYPEASASKIPIQAVVRALAVLEALARAPEGIGLVDLSRIVGLHKATVFRLVRTMVLLGYVEQAGNRELYSISEARRLTRLLDRQSRRRVPVRS